MCCESFVGSHGIYEVGKKKPKPQEKETPIFFDSHA